MTDRQKFANVMAAMAAWFNKGALQPAILEAYWRECGTLTDQGFAAAAAKVMATNEFMPTAQAILAAAGVSPKLHAAEAWEAVIGAVREHGYTHSVDFGPLVNAVVRNMGGWLRLNDIERDVMPFERKRFEDLFETFSAKPAEFLNGEPLLGEYGGEAIPIAIGGIKPKRREIAPQENQIAGLIRGLAENAR